MYNDVEEILQKLYSQFVKDVIPIRKGRSVKRVRKNVHSKANIKYLLILNHPIETLMTLPLAMIPEKKVSFYTFALIPKTIPPDSVQKIFEAFKNIAFHIRNLYSKFV
jgi:hypothetical protein